MTFDFFDAAKFMIFLITGGLALLLWIVISLNKNPREKIGWSIIIIIIYLSSAWGLYQRITIRPQNFAKQEKNKAEIPSEQDYKERYEKGKAIFQQRCKTAGENIYKTIDGVDGILLLKVRPKYQDIFGYDSMHPGAALIGKSGGEGYIASFLRYEMEDPGNTRRNMQLSDKPTPIPGYRFVDAIDPSDGRRYRYTNVYGPNNLPPAIYMPIPALNKELATGTPPRYAVTYEDLVDPEDRKYWVAGTIIKVLDTKTNEVIAEQPRYLFDTGLGNTAGHRNPWGWASSHTPGCSNEPRFYGETRFFVDQVLKTIQGNK